MRIGIDARFYGSIGKGLGRYTQKLIEYFETISAPEDEFFIFLRKENFDEYQPKKDNFHKVLANYRWYTLSEQINMPRILNRYNLDVVHFPHFNVPLLYRKKFIITIHDLILLHFPTIKSTTLNPIFYWLKFLAYKIVIKSAIRRAEKVIAVSHFTRNDILEHYHIPENKIVVTYEAAELNTAPEKTKNDDAVLRKYGILKPYILYVGNAYPHKNLETLVLAYKEIEDKNIQLIIVGKEDYFYRKLKTTVKKNGIKNCVFTDFVPDEELDVLYRNSQFYIFPSLYEGFGLPPLEAFAWKIPVASSDHPSMKEILGEAAYFFDATKKENIKKAIVEMSSSDSLRETFAEKGYEHTKKYSWKKMAEETLREYKHTHRI